MKPKTRRRWRRVYRRSRVYVPVIVLLLLGMAVFLPLSTARLTRKIEAEISKAAGFEIQIERARVYLATAEVDLYGVTIPGANGGEPFRIGHVALDGTFGELLTGAGQWPSQILITDPSPAQLEHTPEGIKIRGSLEALLEAIANRIVEEEKEEEKKSLLDMATPAITVRNLRISSSPPMAAMPPVSLTIDQAMVRERTEPGDLYSVEFEGAVTAGMTEELHGRIQYRPRDEVAQAHLFLSGVKGHFRIPGLGSLFADARKLDLSAWSNRRENGNHEVAAEMTITRFELQETQLGGEQWVDSNVTINARATFVPEETLLREINLGLRSENVDIRAAGELKPVSNFPGTGQIIVTKLPPAVLALAQREAAQEGVMIDAMTSPTLRLNVEASGPFLEPMLLQYSGTVALEDWRVSQHSWPSPLIIHRVNGTLTNEAMELPVIDVEFGSMAGTGSARIPFPAADEITMAQLALSLRGRPESLLALAKSEGVLPRVIDDIAMPIAIGFNAQIPLRKEAETGVLALQWQDSAVNGFLTWEQGEVTIRELPRPISLASGRFEFSEAIASLQHVRASYEDMSIDADLSIRAQGRALWDDYPSFEGSIVAGGLVPSIVSIVSQHALIPVSVKTATGEIRAELSAEGRWGAWDELDYHGILTLQKGSAVIDQPLYPISLDELALEAELTPASLKVKRFTGRVEGAGLISGMIDATSSGIETSFEAQSPLWVVEHIIPRETYEIVMEGAGRARGTVRLIPAKPLPQEGDIVRSWLAALRDTENYSIGVLDNSPIRLDIESRIYPGEGAAVFHRDFPQRLSNVRGDITADETGFYLNDVTVQLGDTEDVKVRGYVRLGHIDGTVSVLVDVAAPQLNVNDWLDGWGKRPWAERPYIPPRGKPRVLNEKLMTRVAGTIHTGSVEFLDIHAANVDAEILYEAWRRKPNTLDVLVNSASLYSGKSYGVANVVFPRGERSRFTTSLHGENVAMQLFLQDMLDAPQSFVGSFTGQAVFGGEIGDYATWKGSGQYHVVQSKFIGAQVLRGLTASLNLGREQMEADTQMYGTSHMEESKIYFPDMVIENSQVKMVADGFVALSGDLNYFITVEILTNRFEGVPVVRRFVDAINALKNAFISLRVQGTVSEPEIRTSSLQLDKMQFFQADVKQLERIRESLAAGEARVTADREEARQRIKDSLPTDLPAIK